MLRRIAQPTIAWILASAVAFAQQNQNNNLPLNVQQADAMRRMQSSVTQCPANQPAVSGGQAATTPVRSRPIQQSAAQQTATQLTPAQLCKPN